MPHVRLEYTENVQWKNPIQDFLPKLQAVLIQHARVKPQNCKSRAIELKDYYCTGKSHSGGFIHLEINLLSGRTKEIKTKIGKECHRIMQNYIENIAEIQVSVELRDMDQDGYFTSNQL